MHTIRLLGALTVERDGVVVARLEGQRYGAILAQLAVRPGRAISRDVLLATHWPEVDPTVARNRLSVALHALRDLFGRDEAPVVVADRTSVSLDKARVTTDVAAFETACAAARATTDPARRREALEEAWRLYAGPLLQGFDEEWIEPERERLACAHDDIEQAIQIEGAVPISTAPPPTEPTPAGTPSVLVPPPSPVTRFFGREEELAWVAEAVARGVRLLTVHGAGGLGKTRLAIEAARALVARGLVGEVVWAPLADVRSAEGAVLALNRAAGVKGAVGDPVAGLASALAGRRALLVADNAEQVVVALAEQLPRLLAATPDLVVLATTQRLLLVEGEHVLRLAPLATASEADPSVALLVDRVRQHRRDYAPDAGERASLLALAARLDGLPLALELAAARLGQGAARDLDARLDEGFRAIEDRRRGRPERQRSLRAALEWTLSLLPPATRAHFARLSVFRGEIAVAAAAAVTGAPAVGDLLLELADCSLLVPVADTPDRYRMLPSVREIAASSLAGDARDEAQERFRAWFLDIARGWDARVAGGAAARLAPELDRDRPNLYAALDLSTPMECAEALTATRAETFWAEREAEVLPRIDALEAYTADPSWPLALRASLATFGNRLTRFSGNAARAAAWRARLEALSVEHPGLDALGMERLVASIEAGRLSEAEALADARIAALPPDAPPRERAIRWDMSSRVRHFAGDHAGALPRSERALKELGDFDQPQLRDAITLFLLTIRLALGETEAVLAALRADQAERATRGQPRMPGSLLIEADALRAHGRLDEALAGAREALVQAGGNRRAESYARARLAHIHLDRGECAEAAAQARVAEAAYAAMSRPVDVPFPALIVAEVKGRRGDPDARGELARAARLVLAVEGRRHRPRLVDAARHVDPELARALAGDEWRGALARWLADEAQ